MSKNLKTSETTEKILEGLLNKAREGFDKMCEAWALDSQEIANSVIESKKEFNELFRAAQVHLHERFTTDLPQRVEVYTFESNMMDSIKRIHMLARRGAKLLLP